MGRRRIWNNDYLGLFDNGELRIGNGIEYIKTLNTYETEKLYLQLKYFFEVYDPKFGGTQYRKNPKDI